MSEISSLFKAAADAAAGRNRKILSPPARTADSPAPSGGPATRLHRRSKDETALIRPPLSPETLLVAACCRWPDSAAKGEAVAAAAHAVNWEEVLMVAGNHRVEALVHQALRSAGIGMPPPVAAEFARRAAATARHNLNLAAEAVRLDAALARVDHLFVKGTTLGLLAYGGHQLKGASDIDLLVSPGAVAEASLVLAGLGYRRIVPDRAMPDAAVLRWLAYAKEMLWVHPDTGVAIDLHFALSDSKWLLCGVGLLSPRQSVPVAGGICLPTLARDELFAYLCVHGTYHGWSRLRWLADAAALAGDDPVEIERLHRSAIRLGAGRCSAVALRLSARLLELAVPGTLLAEFGGDRPTRRLEALALSRIRDLGSGGLAGGTWETLRLHASHVLLKKSWRFRLSELRRKALYPYRPSHVTVPAWLRPGYSAVRLLLTRRT